MAPKAAAGGDSAKGKGRQDAAAASAPDAALQASVAEQLRDALKAQATRVIDLFRDWDDDESGSISKKEFRKALPMLGVEATKKDMDALFDMWDPDRSGSIELAEMTKHLRAGPSGALDPKLQAGAVALQTGRSNRFAIRRESQLKKVGIAAVALDPSSAVPLANQLVESLEANNQRVADLFREWDDDGSHKISKKEFRRALPMLGYTVSKEVALQAFEALDPDGSGSIDYKELDMLLRKAKRNGYTIPALPPIKSSKLDKFRKKAAMASTLIESYYNVQPLEYTKRRWFKVSKRRRQLPILTREVDEMFKHEGNGETINTIVQATGTWDTRYHRLFERAEGRLASIEADPTSRRKQRTFDRSMFMLQCNRFAVQPLRCRFMPGDGDVDGDGMDDSVLAKRGKAGFTHGHLRPAGQGGPWALQPLCLSEDVKIRKRIKPPWKLETSIWAPRKATCDALDFYDTDDVLSRSLKIDIELAREDGRLDRFLKTWTGGGQRKSLTDTSPDKGDAKGDAIEACLDVLRQNVRLVYAVFDYYAALGSSSDIFAIQLNAFFSFLKSADIMEEGDSESRVNANAMGTIFKAANVNVEGSGDAAFDNKGSLMRNEYISCVARCGVLLKAELDGTAEKDGMDLAVAAQLICDRMKDKLDEECRENSNLFREINCYVEPTDIVLRKYEASLRCIYKAYATGSSAEYYGDVLHDKSKLDFEEWSRLVKDMQWVDKQFSIWDANLSFVWSRMRVVRECVAKDRARVVQLHFEDFLECLVRTASRKVGIQEKEAHKWGHSDAAQYIIAMQEDGTWESYLLECAKDPPEQPLIEEMTEMLCMMLVRRVTNNLDGDKSTLKPINEKQAKAFFLAGSKAEKATPGPGAYNVGGELGADKPKSPSVAKPGGGLARQGTMKLKQQGSPDDGSRPGTR